MFTYEKKKTFSLKYWYQKLPRPCQKFREKSQTIERVFWELKACFYDENYPTFQTGCPSEVDLGGHAHAFDKYLVQHPKAVCVELPWRNHVLYKPETLQSS